MDQEWMIARQKVTRILQTNGDKIAGDDQQFNKVEKRSD